MYNEDISRLNSNFESYRERLTNFGSEFEPGLFLHILKKNLLLLIFILLVVLVGTFLYLRYTAPVYEAKTIIQLDNRDDAKRVLNVNQFYEDNGLIRDIELMRSKLLVTRVVKKMPLDVTYFEKGEILTNQHYPTSFFSVTVEAIADSSIMGKPIYVNFESADRYRLSLPEGPLGGWHQVGETASNEYFTYRLNLRESARNGQVDRGEMTTYFRLNRAEDLASKFIRQLDIRILNNTAKTIEVSMRHHNAGVARDFVTTHAEEYIDFDLEIKEQSATSILQFIESQLDTVYENLRDSELQLNLYKKENKISNLDNLSGVYFEYFRSFEDELVSLDLDEQMLNEVVKTIRRDSIVDVYNIIPILTGTSYESTIATMLEKLRELLTAREEL
ncbi:MAG TPA: Wzz/FepE/Etk N-terminal domain-containing protein, partial [Cryomorphaceae bacterium]|nr:Wzz/FepE/Etk N-terminal domain-containing protein [Cryomorphaceae bacterium]